MFVFAVEKDKKGIFSIKKSCQAKSGVNQNLKMKHSLFFPLKKKVGIC